MSINNNLYNFNDANIRYYGQSGRGVYALYDANQNVIYYGRSDSNVINRLLSHLNGQEGPCTKAAYYFNSEYAANPSAREAQLLRGHVSIHGKLPTCNNRAA